MTNRTRVTRAFLCCLLSLAAFRAPALAQTGFVNMVDHVHFAAPDPVKAVDWYQKYFGGEKTSEAPDRLMFGPVRVIFQKTDAPLPSSTSVVDQIGFSVADLDATMKRFQADGGKIVTPARAVPGLYKAAVVEDPWGAQLEVVQDPQKLGLHHIHLRAANPATALAWYAGTFGGKVAKLKGKLDGIDYGGIWLLAEQGATTPSQGHAIDHIGFRPVNLNSVVTGLKAKNVKITAEPRLLTLAGGTVVHIAFAEGPDGIRIEMVQRPE